MGILESIKPFWPLILTFVLPRAFSYYRALKTAVRTRPPPRPLSAKAARGLNVLFVSICVFLWLSYSTNAANNGLSNVFAITQTRLGVPTELLFARLALYRSNGVLTADDEALRSKLTSLAMRQAYLRVGPGPILQCPFCHADDPTTYILNALPTQVLFPHLVHLLLLGFATSKSISGAVAAKFRFRTTMTVIAILLFDIYIVAIYELPIDTQKSGPFSLYKSFATFRPLLFCFVDSGLALLIWATATRRFIFFPFLAAAADPSGADADVDPEELLEQTRSLLHDTNTKMQVALMKLRGVNVAQNTIMRDESLNRTENEYWGTVREVEGTATSGSRSTKRHRISEIDQSVFDEDEVQAAMARAFGNGSLDVAASRKEAENFVREVTRPLDQTTPAPAAATSAEAQR